MLIMEIRHKLSLITHLRSFHKTLSDTDIKESLYFEMIVLNSSFEKGSHSIVGLD